jgi:hypothetical protein
MPRTTKTAASRIGASAALAAIALIATATAANAATLNDTGSGFVGKGEVQSAYNLNNPAIQKIIDANDKAFTFSFSQAATQELTSSATQEVTESATQSAHRVLSCTVTVGGIKNPKVFENDGTRDGIKTGSREGTRTGERAGSLNGALSATIDAKARKTGQWTGWNIKSVGEKSFTASGAESFGDATYGDPSFGTYVFDDVEWSGWQAEPGDNPADCLRNDNGAEITDLSDVTTYGVAEVTGTEYGDESFGDTEYGDVTASGAAQVLVTYNNVVKTLSVTAPVV